jgi:hypothetical protein
MMSDQEREPTLSEIFSSVQSLRPQPAQEYARPAFVHRVPRRKIRLDGTRCSPENVLLFPNSRLFYVIDEVASETGEIAVFTNAADAHEITGAWRQEDIDAAEEDRNLTGTQGQERSGGKDSSMPQGGASGSNLGDTKPEDATEADSSIAVASGSKRANQSVASATTADVALAAGGTWYGYVDLFEHANYQGAQWSFYPEWGAIPDFRRVYPTAWWTTDINDRVSSVDVNIWFGPPQRVAWVWLFSEVGYWGDGLATSSSYSYPPETGAGMRANLADVGFNDRASSLMYTFSV